MKLSDAAKLGTEFSQVINKPKQSVLCLAFGWNEHGDYSFNCNRVGLEAIHSGNMAHDGGFADMEFHLVDIQLDMTLFKSLKHGDKDAVVVDWTSLALQPGIKIPSVILKPRRPSSTT